MLSWFGPSLTDEYKWCVQVATGQSCLSCDAHLHLAFVTSLAKVPSLRKVKVEVLSTIKVHQINFD